MGFLYLENSTKQENYFWNLMKN